MPLNEDQILDLAISGGISNEIAKFAIEEVRKGGAVDIVDGEIRRIEAPQRFEQLPEAAGPLGALGVGAETGFKEIGAGVLQLAGRLGELGDIEGARALQEAAGRFTGEQRERFEAETADFPITGEVGRVAGH